MFGLALITIFQEVKDDPTLQLLVFMAWSFWMTMLYVLWRRTALIASGAAVGSKNTEQPPLAAAIAIRERTTLFVFPLLLFDDLFTDVIFLDVDRSLLYSF